MCVCLASLFIRLLIDTYVVVLSCYKNNAAVGIRQQKSFQVCIFISSVYVPRSGIAGSYGSSIFNFFEESPYHFP